MVGSDGDDTIDGDDGANLVAGMRGDDEIAGGGGADTLWSGRGDDMLHGGPGLNHLTDGPGVDRFVFDEETGDAVVHRLRRRSDRPDRMYFTRSKFERHLTIEEGGFLIEVGANVIRVEVGVEPGVADFMG